MVRPRSARAHPLRRTVQKDLPLPDRHLGLDIVDQLTTRRKCLVAVRGAHRDDDGDVTDAEQTRPVCDGHGQHRVHVGYAGCHPSHLGAGTRMGRVLQFGDPAPAVVVTYRAHEKRDPTHVGPADGMQALVDRQLLLPDCREEEPSGPWLSRTRPSGRFAVNDFESNSSEINGWAGDATVAGVMVMVMVAGRAAGTGPRVRFSADMTHLSDRRAATQPMPASSGWGHRRTDG